MRTITINSLLHIKDEMDLYRHNEFHSLFHLFYVNLRQIQRNQCLHKNSNTYVCIFIYMNTHTHECKYIYI
jgi:hypothetical protein